MMTGGELLPSKDIHPTKHLSTSNQSPNKYLKFFNQNQMKKKFISGLLLMALTAGGFSTFTSCKDTDEDLRSELQEQYGDLDKWVKGKLAGLNRRYNYPP